MELFPDTHDPDTRFARIVPERGIDAAPDGLTYAIPQDLAALLVGDRVQVPLGRGNRPAPGFVVEIDTQPDLDIAKIKPILRRDPGGGRLTPHLLELGRWMSGYYCCPLGMVYTTMLPAAVKKGTGRTTRTLVRVTDVDTTDLKITSLQQKVIDVTRAFMNDNPGSRGIEARDLAQDAGCKTIGPVKRLIESGVLEAHSASTVHALWEQFEVDDSVLGADDITLTPGQRSILENIQPRLDSGFGVHAIYGVTGSGKTEIYLRLIDQVVAAGKCAIVLVPEISLTPQTARRFLGRFEENVAILHSGLTAAQRHHQWSAVAEGRAQVVVGARSAVFAPIDDDRLALIVVDEEHDGSYKQDQLPRYHARDVAIKRAQLSGAQVILGSATPSLETYYNAFDRKVYAWHTLTERVPGAKLPRVEVVDFAAEMREHHDRHVHLLGPRLESAIRETLKADRQVMLLLNRRGYANYIACPDQLCGWVMSCDYCDAAMVYHKDRALPAGGVVRCHHCLAEQILPKQCPLCTRRVVTFGLGTQRIEEELARKFEGLSQGETLLRMDSDTMQRARDYYNALDRFRQGEIRVLVGTQMIAKGLDFPNVRLVGVINADTSINLPDFRAAERTFQLVSQVAGRCGRGVEPGHVIVQSFQPDLDAIQRAAAHDYLGFARTELEDRAQALLPPIGRMARIVLRDLDHAKCAQRARALADRMESLREDAKTKPTDIVRLRGPAPCPLSRINDYHRQSVEIMASSAGPVQRMLTLLRNEGLAISDASTAIDVDPINLL